MTDYEFFEVSRREQRCYHTDWDRPMEAFRTLEGLHRIEIMQDAQDEMTIRGSHIMEAGCAVGLAQVNERLGVALPADIDQFYRQYNGGMLLCREIYRLMPAAEIIEVNLTLRARTVERQDIPFGIVRFCDIRDGCYIALRRIEGEDWSIIYAEDGYTIQELMYDPGLVKEYSWDSSFAAWLERMCKTDGWPSALQVYGHDHPPMERLGSMERERET